MKALRPQAERLACQSGLHRTQFPVAISVSKQRRASSLRVRISQVDRVKTDPDTTPAPQDSLNGSTSYSTPVVVEAASTTRAETPVAPAATAVGLVGEAASENVDRPFVPVIDFQVLADTLLGDPEVVLRDKTLMGEPTDTPTVGSWCPVWQQRSSAAGFHTTPDSSSPYSFHWSTSAPHTLHSGLYSSGSLTRFASDTLGSVAAAKWQCIPFVTLPQHHQPPAQS